MADRKKHEIISTDGIKKHVMEFKVKANFFNQ